MYRYMTFTYTLIYSEDAPCHKRKTITKLALFISFEKLYMALWRWSKEARIGVLDDALATELLDGPVTFDGDQTVLDVQLT